ARVLAALVRLALGGFMRLARGLVLGFALLGADRGGRRQRAQDRNQSKQLHVLTSRPRIFRAASTATCDESADSFFRSASTVAFSRARASASLRCAAAVASASNVCSRACASLRATARSPAPTRRASASAASARASRC